MPRHRTYMGDDGRDHGLPIGLGPLLVQRRHGQPAGNTVEFGKRVAASMSSQLNVQGLTIRWIEATGRNRPELIEMHDADKYAVLPDFPSFEPYAIALPRNDSALQLEVSRGLSQAFGSAAIKEIFERTFGPSAEPTALLQALYLDGRIPK